MDETVPTQPPNTNEYIDKITLELLINKNQYNKYMATADPEKYKKISEFSAKLLKYQNKIMALTEEYCSSTKVQKNNEMDEMFNNYARACIRYFEMKELEKSGENGYFEDAEEADVLFDIQPVHSFWGKGATKKN
jgi:hypothetical protein